MKLHIPSEKAHIFASLPRKDRAPFSEIAATQTFKLIGWAGVTAGIYLLQKSSDSFGLQLIPYLLGLLIVWDMSAKLGWEPAVERNDGELYIILTWSYAIRLLFVGLFSMFTAWAVIFWLAPLVNAHILSVR